MQRNPWVEVDFGAPFNVSRLEIENRPDGNYPERLGNFRVFADGKTLGMFSYQQFQGEPSKIVIPVNQTVRVVRVQISGVSHLHLGALRAFHLKPFIQFGDVALKKGVTMSSLYGDYFAHRLVDGNSVSFMHTINEVKGHTFFLSFFRPLPLFFSVITTLSIFEKPNPWVEVDLKGSFAVAHLEIENRPDGNCLDRLGYFKVFTDGKLLGLFQYLEMQGHPPKISIPVNNIIRSVRVQIEGKNFLHLGTLRAIGFPENLELVDLALRKSVTMSSQYEQCAAQRLVDGNPTSFMHTEHEVGSSFRSPSFLEPDTSLCHSATPGWK